MRNSLSSTNTGVWVDHRRAVVISLQGDKPAVETVESDIDSQPTETTGGRGATAGSPTVFPEGKPERRLEQTLTRFYRDIESRLNGSGNVYIFGPGEARTELKKHLGANKQFADTNIEVEPADRMSADEAARKTQEHFSPGSTHKPRPGRQ